MFCLQISIQDYYTAGSCLAKEMHLVTLVSEQRPRPSGLAAVSHLKKLFSPFASPAGQPHSTQTEAASQNVAAVLPQAP